MLDWALRAALKHPGFVLMETGGTPADHFTAPRTPTYQPAEVLYACVGTPDDDLLPFLSYPYRKGWKKKDILSPKESGRSEKEIAAFFQNWLFFSFLADVLRKPIDRMDFVVLNSSDELVLTTQPLKKLLQDWCKRDCVLSQPAQERHGKRVDEIMSRICDVMSEWTLQFNSPLNDWATTYIVAIAEQIDLLVHKTYSKGLGGTIRNWEVCWKFENGQGLPDPPWSGTGRPWAAARGNAHRVLTMAMKSKGWCPSDIQRLQETVPLYGILFASMMTPPGLEKLDPAGHCDQAFDVLGNMHHQCSKKKCVAHQCDDTTYKTKHIVEDCQCQHYSVDTDKVTQLLAQGQLPVLEFDPKTGIKVSPARRGLEYTAVSHVWSDGLGKPNSNSLPQCQISRLIGLIRGSECLSEPTRFWIDTLCCPVRPPWARKAAIRLMKETYQDASKVLVIESYINAFSIAGATRIEILATLWCSKWNRRLWTLNEMMLGQARLHFCFKDATVKLEDLTYGSGQSLWGLSQAHTLSATAVQDLALQQDFDDRAGFSRWVLNNPQLFDNISSASINAVSLLLGFVPYRDTSKASDEAVCVGILLDLNMKRISNAFDNEERMEVFWSLLADIPPEIIFMRGPKLSRKGFRWAPSTFSLGQQIWCGHDRSDEETGRIGPRGLTIQFLGWELGCKPGHPIADDGFAVLDMDKTAYLVMPR